MSRRSRHGRRPPTSTTPQEPESGIVAEHPRAATATAPAADGGLVETRADIPVSPAPVVVADGASAPHVASPVARPPAESAEAVAASADAVPTASARETSMVSSVGSPSRGVALSSGGADLPRGPGAANGRVATPVAPEGDVAAAQDAEALRTTCTQAQLRRFIKSRPWIPMHELRRRFGIYGGDDDVTPVRIGNATIFVGLPTPEGRMLGELLSSGDVGYELSLDPGAPIVVGVYPMRPVPRG